MEYTQKVKRKGDIYVFLKGCELAWELLSKSYIVKNN
jgi:hypothetical protein